MEGRTAAGPSWWLARHGPAWRANIAWDTLDLSGPHWTVFDTMLPDAIQIADPLRLVRLANQRLDECRRRIQNQTLGNRDRKTDPLYQARRLLTKGDERLQDKGRTKLLGLLEARNPSGDELNEPVLIVAEIHHAPSKGRKDVGAVSAPPKEGGL